MKISTWFFILGAVVLVLGMVVLPQDDTSLIRSGLGGVFLGAAYVIGYFSGRLEGAGR